MNNNRLTGRDLHRILTAKRNREEKHGRELNLRELTMWSILDDLQSGRLVNDLGLPSVIVKAPGFLWWKQRRAGQAWDTYEQQATDNQ